MRKRTILHTARLSLREFDYLDTKFIHHLVNTPEWLQFIGDRGVQSEKDAIAYLDNGPLKSYAVNGFGLWLVELRETGIPIGMCGLIKRDTLDDVDIGFAMLPEYAGNGYGFEIASATLKYGIEELKLKTILAITDPANIASIRLLMKIGLRFEKTIQSHGDQLLLFSTDKPMDDLVEIDQLSALFFDIFTNVGDKVPKVEVLNDLLIPTGSIINNTAGKSEIYSVKEFVESRSEILNSGRLTGFSEREVTSDTNIFEGIASRFVLYEKSGHLDGRYFETKGVKTIQFVRISNEWKIASVMWNDEVQ